MSFTDAVSSVYRNYAKFDGRAPRSEYWWFTLFTVLVVVAGFLLGAIAYAASRSSAVYGVVGVGLIIFVIASIIPSIAVGVRRLHDSDKSGWWYLIGFIPYIGSFILLIFFLLPSTPGYNRFGPSPGRSTAAQRAQYWGPSRPEALRKFAEDAQRAAASGYHPVWQEWRMGPTGEVLEVVYDLAPAPYAWGQGGYGPPGQGAYAQGPGPYPQGGGGAAYPGAPTAYPPGGTWYQGGPSASPAAGGAEPSSGQPSSGPPQPPNWG